MKIRVIRHIISGAIAWALFGYYWGLVAQRRITENTARGLIILAICVAIIWLLTSLWVQHNRRRFAGRPDRRTRRSAPGGLPDHDAIGQRIELVQGDVPLDQSPLVIVDVDQETRTKSFRAAPLPDERSAT